MPFKHKANKIIKVDSKYKITLDSEHSNIMEKIQKNQKDLPKLEKRLSILKNKITNKKFKNIDEKMKLVDDYKILKLKIKNIKKEEQTYMLNNSKYIFNYFEEKQKIKEDTNTKKSLESFFNIKKKEPNTTNAEISYSKQYLRNINEEFIDINDFVQNSELCDYCHGELAPIDSEGVLLCKKCFKQQPYLVEHEKPSYKEPPKEVSFYAYKKINHFREVLAQFQAKETTQIDEVIIENIKKQIKKERLTIDQLTNTKTKEILKKLGYNKYYEHIPFIKDKLGIKPPIMSIELENKLCNLFIQIQKPYSKFCPDNRKNFLNYNYILYKLCELLEEDQYLPYLNMLKDQFKRIEQDEIWKQICEYLNWEFIPTL
jgi:hypothetical protein